MARVVVDAEGGDHGLPVVLDGVCRLSMEDTDIQMLLVGDADAITEALETRRHNPARIQVRHSGGAIPMAEDPRSALESRPDCSILVAMKCLAAGDADALGFFGFAYYVENQDKLRAVPIKVGDGPAVAPSFDSIASGAYTPLSRPLFLYVRADRARNKGVRGFLDFALENAGAVVKDVGYVPLPEPMMAVVRERLAKGTTGTMFKDGKSSVDLRVALGMKGS